MTRHLTQQEFADALTHDSASGTTFHLSTCEQCRAELDRFESNMGLLRNSAILWSVERTGTMPALRQPTRWQQPYLMALAATAMLVCGIATSRFATTPHRTGEHAPSVQTQLKNDNQLLEAVNRELDAPVAPALEPLLTVSEAQNSARQQAD